MENQNKKFATPATFANQFTAKKKKRYIIYETQTNFKVATALC